MTPRKAPITDRGETVLRLIAEMADEQEARNAAMTADYGPEYASHMAGWVSGVRSAHRILAEFLIEIERDAANNASHVVAEHRRRSDAYFASLRPVNGEVF